MRLLTRKYPNDDPDGNGKNRQNGQKPIRSIFDRTSIQHFQRNLTACIGRCFRQNHLKRSCVGLIESIHDDFAAASAEIGSVIFIVLLTGHHTDIMYIIERVLIINDIIKSHACSAVVVFAYAATTDRPVP